MKLTKTITKTITLMAIFYQHLLNVYVPEKWHGSEYRWYQFGIFGGQVALALVAAWFTVRGW